MDRAQKRRESRIGARDAAEPALGQSRPVGRLVERRAKRGEPRVRGSSTQVRARLGGEGGERELAHAVSSRRRAVRQRLGEVLAARRARAGERRDRRRDARDARAARAPRAAAARRRASSSVVRLRVRAGSACASRVASRDDALADRRRGLTGRRRELAARGRGTVTTRSKRSRSARESFVAERASRCGEHEHSAAGSPRPPQGQRFIVATSWKRAGKTRPPDDARDGDDAVLERLAERLERRPLELGQLVEQQDAAVGEARLARRGAATAADDRRPSTRCGAARGTAARSISAPSGASTPATEWMRVTSSACVGVERRQDPRQAPREHRLAGARRAGEQQVVPAGGGELERAPRPLLAAYVGEVRARRASGRRRGGT